MTLKGTEKGSRSTRPAVIGLLVAGVIVLGLAITLVVAASHARRWTLAAASHRLGHPVHVDGNLTISPGLGGLAVRFTHLRVDQPSWAGPGSMIEIDRGLLKLPWSALVGDRRLDDLELDGVRVALRRNAAGQANWSAPGGKPRSAPRLGRLVIQRGVLDLQDARRDLSFHGGADAVVDRGASQMTLTGGGLASGRPWTLRVVSTQPVFGSSRFALVLQTSLDGVEGRSTAHFAGDLQLTRTPEIDGRLSGAGPDLHAFSQLTGLPLPRTPPYQIAAHIAATGKGVRLDGIGGRVGASDLSGAMTVTPLPGGRRLDAELSSRSLRISDLFFVAGGGTLTRRGAGGHQLLPDGAVNPAPLRKLTGLIRYHAASVQPPTTPTIRSLKLAVRFDHGRLGADPLSLQLASGQAVVRTSLDVTGAVPAYSLAAAFRNADTGEVFKAANAPIKATFNAKADLRGSGPSLAAAAGRASGQISLEALGGRLQETPADVLSADFVRAVLSLLTRNHAQVGLRCAVARFQVSDGQARATVLRMSTDLGGVEGSGGFNLGDDSIDMTLRPIGGLSGPTSVRIAGPLSHPRSTLALDSPGHVIAKVMKTLAPHAKPPVPTCS